MTSEERLRDSASLTDQCLEKNTKQDRMDKLYWEFAKIRDDNKSLFTKEVQKYIFFELFIIQDTPTEMNI